MKKFFTSLVLAVALMASAFSSAFANKLYSEQFGRWELMAWSNNNHFCALKTYMEGGKTFAIRQTSTNGYTLVVTDPNVAFYTGTTSVDVYFDGEYFGSGTERTYEKWPTQVFIEVGYDSDFMSKVILASNIQIKSSDVDYDLGLSGTEILGDKLQTCVNSFGF